MAITFIKGEPPRTTKNGRASEFVNELKKNKNVWAEYPSDSPSSAMYFKKKFEGVEACTRSVNGEVKVYVRYVGTPASKTKAA